MGYHRKKITCGEYGEVSKIQEEYEEFIDAIEQDNKIMALCELSDLIGAIEGYVAHWYPSLNLEYVLKMKDATKNAFLDGTRKIKIIAPSVENVDRTKSPYAQYPPWFSQDKFDQLIEQLQKPYNENDIPSE